MGMSFDLLLKLPCNLLPSGFVLGDELRRKQRVGDGHPGLGLTMGFESHVDHALISGPGVETPRESIGLSQVEQLQVKLIRFGRSSTKYLPRT